jgi:hypothetical protein
VNIAFPRHYSKNQEENYENNHDGLSSDSRHGTRSSPARLRLGAAPLTPYEIQRRWCVLIVVLTRRRSHSGLSVLSDFRKPQVF